MISLVDVSSQAETVKAVSDLLQLMKNPQEKRDITSIYIALSRNIYSYIKLSSPWL